MKRFVSNSLCMYMYSTKNIAKTREWVHVNELEVLIKEMFNVSNSANCNQFEKPCLRTDDGSADAYRVSIQFDLHIDNESVYVGSIEEWIASLNFCRISHLQFNIQTSGALFNELPEYLELSLDMYPCILRGIK